MLTRQEDILLLNGKPFAKMRQVSEFERKGKAKYTYSLFELDSCGHPIYRSKEEIVTDLNKFVNHYFKPINNE